MKNITRSSILLGLGLIAAGNFITTPVSAAPGDRPVLRDQKRNDRNDDRRDDKRPGNWNNGRPGNNNNRPGWNNGRPGNNNNNRPGWNNGRPGNNNIMSGYGRPYSSNRDVNFVARVVNNTRGKDFTASAGGRTFRVMAVNGEPRGLRVGTTVRLNGRWDGNTFRALQVYVNR